MRISSAVLALALASCGNAAQPAAGGTAIACALGEGSTFADDCTLERVAGMKDEFIVRHPDGGFRRLALRNAHVETLDGADEAVSRYTGDPPVLEVIIANDRYRLPADFDAPAR
jgi:hypothetical protein